MMLGNPDSCKAQLFGNLCSVYAVHKASCRVVSGSTVDNSTSDNFIIDKIRFTSEQNHEYDVRKIDVA